MVFGLAWIVSLLHLESERNLCSNIGHMLSVCHSLWMFVSFKLNRELWRWKVSGWKCMITPYFYHSNIFQAAFTPTLPRLFTSPRIALCSRYFLTHLSATPLEEPLSSLAPLPRHLSNAMHGLIIMCWGKSWQKECSCMIWGWNLRSRNTDCLAPHWARIGPKLSRIRAFQRSFTCIASPLVYKRCFRKDFGLRFKGGRRAILVKSSHKPRGIPHPLSLWLTTCYHHQGSTFIRRINIQKLSYLITYHNIPHTCR